MTDKRRNGWAKRYGEIDGRMNEWIDVWMYGSMGRWMYVRTGGWLDGCPVCGRSVFLLQQCRAEVNEL
jgi:hypothetical protein